MQRFHILPSSHTRFALSLKLENCELFHMISHRRMRDTRLEDRMWNATHIKKVSKSISMIEYFFILLELAWRVEREITTQKNIHRHPLSVADWLFFSASQNTKIQNLIDKLIIRATYMELSVDDISIFDCI